MAIQDQAGEYIVVEAVNPSTVTIRYHKDAQHRTRYKAGSEGKYENTRQEAISVPVDMNAIADGTVSIRDNNVIAGYTAIKTLPEFSEYIDI